MAAPNLCAYDSEGRVLVLVDGREVLVHGGADEAPIWRHTVDVDLVGLAAAGDAVITLEADGMLRWWSMDDGAALGSVNAGASPIALAVARREATCAVVLPTGVAVVKRGMPARTITVEGASAAAFADEGARLAVGTEEGVVKIVTAAGDALGQGKLDAAVRSLCWSPAGFWLATAGERVVKIPAEGGEVEHVTRAGGMAPDCVAASDDGSMFAARLTDELMMALAYPSRETVVQLRYMDKTIAGVAFGKGRRLGVGLSAGDGNFVDIMGKQLLRSDTFEGRTHNRWMVSVVIEPDALAKKPAPAPAAAPPPPRAPAPAPPLPPPQARSVPWLPIVFAVAGLLLLASRHC